MSQNLTLEQLNNCSKDDLIVMIISLQAQMQQLNENFENLVEQIRISNQHQFGRKTEKMEGQLSFFNECESLCDDTLPEPALEEAVPTATKKKKQTGQRNADLKGFPEESFDHDVTSNQLNQVFGEGNWRELPAEEYKRLRYEPASWTVEKHTIHVYVGTDGEHQDEFLRGKRPKDLLRNSILTPSLGAAIMNAKYVNSIPVARIESEFQRNGVNLSRQTMANWVIQCANKYFSSMYDLLHRELLQLHVTQADETPVEVIHDGRSSGSKSYMWVHRSGELYPERPIVLYEYQKTRHSDHPKEFYQGFHGVLVTDGLSQYHKISSELDGLMNANCWAHARRDFSDAVKAIGTSNDMAVKQSIAYQALARIGTIYKLDGALKDLSAEKRKAERQTSIKPLVEEYFTWVRECLEDTTCLPKGATAKGLKYSLNQEQYLKVFLDDGEVPIDNSASERSIRTFCLGKKNWMFMNTIKGAQASAIVYSITETAKLNQLNPYYYLMHLLEQIPKLQDTDGNIEKHKLKELLPWSKHLPEKCYKPRR